MEDLCDICGYRYGPGLLKRVCVGGEWVWVCIDCRDEPAPPVTAKEGD
jgi:hypothetical protein